MSSNKSGHMNLVAHNLKKSLKSKSHTSMTGTFPRPPKPQGKGIVKALGQKKTTGNFAKIEAAKGRGAAIGALQNKLAKRRGQPIPYKA